MPDFHHDWAHMYDWVYEGSFGDAYRRMTEVTCSTASALLGSEKGRIADLGAGTGRLTVPLIESGHEVVAIDASRGMLSVLEEKVRGLGKHAELIAAPMSRFETTPVDLAICVFTVFVYITNEDEMISSIQNVARHLNHGGYFFFDLASDMFFQGGIVMSHRSTDLRRETTVSHLHGELFQITDEISGNRFGKAFDHRESFQIRRWGTDEIFEQLEKNGMERVEFDDSEFRFTGSRYFLFKKK